MRRTRIMLATAVAAGLVAMSGPALASTSQVTVHAGSTSTGTTSFHATTTGFTFTTPNANMLCGNNTTADGHLNLGANADGSDIADIETTDWKDCQAFGFLPMEVTQISTPWELNAGDPTSSTVTPGNITGVSAHVEDVLDPGNPGDVCSFDVTGSVDGYFDEADQTLHITAPVSGSASELTVSNVSSGNCFGQLKNTEPAIFDGYYTITNPLGNIDITQP